MRVRELADPVSERPGRADGDLGPTGRPLPDFPSRDRCSSTGRRGSSPCATRRAGVGKTTTTINLGAALAEYGRRVLLVDFDPQGALSVGLGVNPHELDRTVYNLLMDRGVEAEDILLKTNTAGHGPAAEQHRPVAPPRSSWWARSPASRPWAGCWPPIAADYDYVLIDCQPSLGLLTVNALTAAHGVIIPLECEFFALRGVALLMDTI